MITFVVINVLAVAFMSEDIRAAYADMSGLTFIVLVLGVYRLTDIVTHEKIAEPFRGLFAGHGEGWRGFGRELFGCNSCLGVWIAMLVAYGYVIVPEATYVFMIIMALTGLEGFFSKIYNFFDRR